MISNVIKVKNDSGASKYVQLFEAICEAIEADRFEKGSKLPPVNKLAEELKLSRDTVFAAYRALEKKGIIQSIYRKGYYIKSRNLRVTRNIFLLFDELNGFKENFYYSFKEEVGSHAKIDIFFHNFNINVFKMLIEENFGNYTDYVIMPSGMEKASNIIKKLPEKHTFLLDQPLKNLKTYSGVYQDFEQAVYQGLGEAHYLLKKYKKLFLVYPDKIGYPESLRVGFRKFCIEKQLEHSLVENSVGLPVEKGNAYLIIEDRDLVNIILQSRSKNLRIGKDIGIISYNDTSLKQIVDVGITTITTDFKQMGQLMAKMVMNKEKEGVDNPWKLVIRNSL